MASWIGGRLASRLGKTMEDLLRLTTLHSRFGVEIHDVDLRRVTAIEGYPAIRQAFEAHSLLLFRDQQLDDAAHLALGALFGPIEDRSQGKDGPDPTVSRVTNRRDGEGALYIASHAFAVEGLPEAEGQRFIDELIAFATRAERVHTHAWRLGDVLIWDERATLHRGRPWPYGEERTLASICISARKV